ncbi:MAG: hydroxyacid dehydrogenase [Acidimicrobiales bacterium]|jgi:phosphoglycerate dehydrogenase-like enzyme
MTPALRGLYVMRDDVFAEVYGEDSRREIEKYVSVEFPQMDARALREHPERLKDIDLILASWGCPRFDEELLSGANRLSVVFYAAGSVHRLVSPSFWSRGVRIVSARDAIAIRVAEFTTSLIYLSLKQFWRYERAMFAEKRWLDHWAVPGTVDSNVGLFALGSVGRLVAERLQSSELRVLAHDPYATVETAERAGCHLVGLEELFSSCDVVSLHAPLLPETTGIVGHSLLALLRPGATIINTSRGGIIDQAALVDVLERRPDLTAVLDVVEPEPLPSGSRLFDLPNVVMTPHIAGNIARERRALGRAMAEEVKRLASGEALQWVVDASSLARSA